MSVAVTIHSMYFIKYIVILKHKILLGVCNVTVITMVHQFLIWLTEHTHKTFGYALGIYMKSISDPFIFTVFSWWLYDMFWTWKYIFVRRSIYACTKMIGFKHNSYTYLVTLFSKTEIQCTILDLKHNIGKEELN